MRAAHVVPVEAARAEGHSDGLTEGRTEGRADLLIRLPGVRFGTLPAETLERIRAGTADDHARWAERLLTAASPAAVLLPPAPQAVRTRRNRPVQPWVETRLYYAA